jgi:hypothetical protein
LKDKPEEKGTSEENMAETVSERVRLFAHPESEI